MQKNHEIPTEYLFMIFDLGTASFGNRTLFIKIKENDPLINCFGPIYIDFDDYPRYSGRISAIFEKLLMKIFNVIMVMLIHQAKQIVFMG